VRRSLCLLCREWHQTCFGHAPERNILTLHGFATVLACCTAIVSKMVSMVLPGSPEPSHPQEGVASDATPQSYEPSQHSVSDGRMGEHRNGSVTSKESAATNKGLVNDSGEKSKVEQPDEDRVVHTKHGTSNGVVTLTSSKAHHAYEESLRHNGARTPREKRKAGVKGQKRADMAKSELASGRRAGAGWEKSA